MNIVIKEQIINTDEYKTLIEINIDKFDLNYSINEILINIDCHYKNLVFLSKNKTIIPCLDYYYNKDGHLEFYKTLLDVPISDFNEYGIIIEDNIQLAIIEGIGSASGIDELFLVFYNSLISFASAHPILFSVAMDFSISKFKEIIRKILGYIESKCTFGTFKRAIYHKKCLTEKDLYNAFELKNINTDTRETEAVISIILEYLGYEYNEKSKQWILNEKNKK